MKDIIVKLLSVKSLVTIATTIAFVIAFCNHTISESNFMEIFKLIIIFYFGTQVGKNAEK